MKKYILTITLIGILVGMGIYIWDLRKRMDQADLVLQGLTSMSLPVLKQKQDEKDVYVSTWQALDQNLNQRFQEIDARLKKLEK